MKTAKADAALIVVTAIWGCTFLMVQNALNDVSPVLFLGFRFAIASCAVFLVYHRKLQKVAILPGIASGVFLYLGYAFQTAGLQYTTASKSAFLTSLCTPLVPLASSLVYRLVPKPFELAGILIATTGMLLLTMPPGGIPAINRGDWLTVLCAAAFAGQLLAVSHAAGKGNFETLALAQMLTVSLLSFASFALLEKPHFQATRSMLSAVVFTGLFASALAFSVQAWAQQFTSATRAAIIYTLEPVFAVITSWFLLRERLGARGLAGAALILLGILAVELKRTAAYEHP